MPNVIDYRPDSEDLEQLTRGWVMANRINDITARPDTKRYRRYMQVVQDGFVDRHATDPDQAWRHKELMPRALEAYSLRHGVDPQRGKLYALPDFRIASAPDAIEADLAGITVRCRQTADTYLEAVNIGVTPEMQRRAQAMMWVTGFPYWIVLDYFEDAASRTRKLYEHDLYADKHHMEQLGDAMVGFYQKSLLRAARAV
jgi:hypothetical protein